jgi:hypothetical protein
VQATPGMIASLGIMRRGQKLSDLLKPFNWAAMFGTTDDRKQIGNLDNIKRVIFETPHEVEMDV